MQYWTPKGRQICRIPQQGHEEQQPPGQHGKYNTGLHSGLLGKQAFQNGGALVCVAKITLDNAPRPLLGLPLLRWIEKAPALRQFSQPL